MKLFNYLFTDNNSFSLLLTKGWNFKKWSSFLFTLGVFKFELSLVKYGQKSKVRTVLKTSGSQLFKTFTFDLWPCFTRDNSDWTHQLLKENRTFFKISPFTPPTSSLFSSSHVLTPPNSSSNLQPKKTTTNYNSKLLVGGRGKKGGWYVRGER